MSLPEHYRNAGACQTCAYRGESILNGAFVCDRHQARVMGWGICDDYQTRKENRRP
ncbi:MAG: hypothetical protein GX837_06715 [Methanomicrobiales archaeon]|nr:hypothetical protein [Methanomicrobiales archaeon]